MSLKDKLRNAAQRISGSEEMHRQARREAAADVMPDLAEHRKQMEEFAAAAKAEKDRDKRRELKDLHDQAWRRFRDLSVRVMLRQQKEP